MVLNECIQAGICFFTAKYEILQLYPNGHSFFKAKYKILQLYPNNNSIFYSEIQNFENSTQTAIRFSQPKKIFRIVPKVPFILRLQVVPKQSFAFWQQVKKSKVASNLPFVFWPRNTKFEVIPKRPFVFLTKNGKNGTLVLVFSVPLVFRWLTLPNFYFKMITGNWFCELLRLPDKVNLCSYFVFVCWYEVR